MPYVAAFEVWSYFKAFIDFLGIQGSCWVIFWSSFDEKISFFVFVLNLVVKSAIVGCSFVKVLLIDSLMLLVIDI